MNDIIVNKVAESGLLEIDLEKFYPKAEIATFDMKDYLFMGLILKEKDFRETLKSMDFSLFRDKYVAVTCTADAIIPVWAYMLVASSIQPFAKDIMFGDEQSIHQTLFLRSLATININDFLDKRVVIKGCGDRAVGAFAYLEITKKVAPGSKKYHVWRTLQYCTRF